MLFSYVNLSEDRRNVVSPLNSTNNKDGAGGQTPGFSVWSILDDFQSGLVWK